MARRLVWVLLGVALVISGCGKKSEESIPLDLSRAGRSPAPFVPVPEVMMAPAHDVDAATEPQRLLSYKHQLGVSMPAAQIEAGLKSLQTACQAVPAQGCVVMESKLQKEPYQSAHVSMNVRRAAVEALRAQASSLGKITGQHTEAEDVTNAVTDSTRRLAMNKALREDLLDLRRQSRGNIDALIKATEKLSEVQSEIESTEAELARLNKRVAMDDLSIDLSGSDSVVVGRHPISDALSRFADNLAGGVGGLIETLAWGLPWLVLLALLPFVVRGLRKIWKLGRR